jgi:hypothetical protein
MPDICFQQMSGMNNVIHWFKGTFNSARHLFSRDHKMSHPELRGTLNNARHWFKSARHLFNL